MESNYLSLTKDCGILLQGTPQDYPDGMVAAINKPYGWSSSDVVRKIKFRLKRFFKVKNIKVGHAGTLDPLATGVLLVCIGKATKLSEELQKTRKEYIAEFTFGATTPSFDLEKPIDAEYPWEHITPEMVQDMVRSFIGPQDQVPPVFSAKFVDGLRAYEAARQGIEIELKSSPIEIYDIEILKMDLPRVRMRIECSKGTYIRALARDMGAALRSGAHLTELIRTASGGTRISDCVSPDEFEQFIPAPPESHCL